MAILKMGELLAGIRGSIGGVTYSANHTGPYAKRYRKPVNPRSTKQGTQRQILSTIAQAWASLSAGEQAAWDTWAALPAQEKTNSLGNPYYLSGYQWFVAINLNLATVGRGQSDTPPTDTVPAAPTITSLHISTGGAPLSNITYLDGTFGYGGPYPYESEKSVGLGQNVGAGTAWTNPTNITANDAADATIAFASPGSSQQLRGTTCSFAIPTNATITGVRLYLDYAEVTLATRTLNLIIGGAKSGTPKTAAGTLASGYYYWGSDGDLWGNAITPTQVNATNFGGCLEVSAIAGSCTVDHMKVRVYYTVPPDQPPEDCVIELFMSSSQGKLVKTSNYRLLIATRTPGVTQVFFQTELEALIGIPLETWKAFARVYRQHVDGYRSAPTSITDIV